ncbi:nucleotide-binding universal stress UspA family protein [Methanohalophilus levihalophilus]|uniref:universal stress protein n=1 Tax=Methanohalophilus levihalophilus TaxID=1431282 RepID=UPI001AE47D37|nr:universal stress protein [Methanohalophilus levihalophilus]MBP2030768.1 nucleotide-binding universal stress UspA family protein [Methanohalophilus levihalophilus]
MKCSKILIAVAGSEHSKEVLKQGLSTAAVLGADAQIIYVIQPPSLLSGQSSWTPPRRILEEVGKDVFNKARNIADEKGVSIKTTIAEGNAAEEIMSFAQKRDMDLIVIGAVGEGGSSIVRVGGIAGKIVRNAGKPVLVVH